ncbi:MAG: rRNA maturation RNase YbeY [Desulfatitalea sp.]|nr:rRNA maturation RNase YbeY [Desulfatitalea sp.]
MAILIDNQQANHPIAIKDVQRNAQAILNVLGCPDGELSILIVDDPAIARLNAQYLQHEGPTNVISFPMREGAHGDLHPALLGDVVISMDTCARESAEAGMDMAERFLELLIHGILHLVGYDHVHSEAEANVMEAKSLELMEIVYKRA